MGDGCQAPSSILFVCSSPSSDRRLTLLKPEPDPIPTVLLSQKLGSWLLALGILLPQVPSLSFSSLPMCRLSGASDSLSRVPPVWITNLAFVGTAPIILRWSPPAVVQP